MLAKAVGVVLRRQIFKPPTNWHRATYLANSHVSTDIVLAADRILNHGRFHSSGFHYSRLRKVIIILKTPEQAVHYYDNWITPR